MPIAMQIYWLFLKHLFFSKQTPSNQLIFRICGKTRHIDHHRILIVNMLDEPAILSNHNELN